MSAYLYQTNTDPHLMLLSLMPLAIVNYAAFDRTEQGLILALVSGFGAPLSELLLMAAFHVWHYPQVEQNILVGVAGGIPMWIPVCYFFYVPAVASFARFLRNSV